MVAERQELTQGANEKYILCATVMAIVCNAVADLIQREVLTEDQLRAAITNSGGIAYRSRFLKRECRKLRISEPVRLELANMAASKAFSAARGDFGEDLER